jgi:hypothetical protein
MNHTPFRGLIYLILAILIMAVQLSNIQAQTQAKASGEKVGGLAPPDPGWEKHFMMPGKTF